MKKLFFIILLSTLFINANSVDAFDNAIKEFKFNYHLNGNTLTFDNLENNETQRELKARFEKIIPYFLALDGLFSKERMEAYHEYFRTITLNASRKSYLKEYAVDKPIEENKWINKGFFSYGYPYYESFFKVLNSYLRYLKNNPSPKNQELFLQLSHKSLTEVLSHSKNSFYPGTPWLKELYIAIGEYEIIKKYPPPNDKVLFYKRLLAMKEDALRVFEPTKKMPPKVIAELKRVREFEKRKLDNYYTEYFKILEENSKKKLNEFTKHYTEPWKYKSKSYELKLSYLSSYNFHRKLWFASNILTNNFWIKEQKEAQLAYNKLLEKRVLFTPWYLYLIYGMLGLFVIYLMSMLFGTLKWFYMKLTQ